MAVCLDPSENTVIYKLFCPNDDGDYNLISTEALELTAEKYLSQISGFLRRYIWQNDPFNLRVVDSSTTGFPPHLEGITCYEDNDEDEWFIVYLLYYLSEKNKNLIIQIQDEDGEFLLIEAADHIPKWLNLKTSKNRVFIHQGALHIIPKAWTPNDAIQLPKGVPSLSTAVSFVRQFPSITKASSSVQEMIRDRIKEYPMRIDEYKHRAHCCVPCPVTAILKEDPSLLSQAVKAFYLRDPIDLKACRAMRYFAPETKVMSEVTFTRCLYAQLSSQNYEPDKMTGWNLPPVNHPDRKAHELGMKLACGFEILASNAEKRMEVGKDDAEYDFRSDVRWKRFAKNLKDRGYFRDEVEGSKMHNTLMLKAKEFYLSSLNRGATASSGTPASSSPGVRVLKLLKTVNNNYEEMKEAEKSLRPPDDDSWMVITPEILDSMLEKMTAKPMDATTAKTITDGIKSFVHSYSDIEGVEPPIHNSNSKKQKINFDPDAFNEAVSKILDFHIPHSDDDESSSSMSGYSDDDNDDVVLGEGRRGKYNRRSERVKVFNEMNEYMDQMDRELAKTNVGLSFEKKLPPKASVEEEAGPSSDINDEDDGFQPVDVNLTALKNLLESYSSQQGLPGPVGNIFSSMGMEVPDNSDP
ncbi:protein ecdysoneless homolog [Argiope bruennichi]|uniref:Protein ecdysoneless like protein n=1 Tax=Argiope bruennichi TaxID=94029 RepID=A0A8T0FZX3_ARGBR|nr:protein ecdysoneless homolog [Argiope bruennichi]KAF8796322.1 Protein ecdysoneless like protein [Argiope bruennichi]